MFKGLLKGLVILIFAALLIAFIIFHPTYVSELTFQGESIAIVRSQHNIPNIRAQTRKGFLYGMGRVHAEDRLFQMTFKSLVAQGRLSEFLG
jgi:penicillin amidase